MSTKQNKGKAIKAGQPKKPTAEVTPEANYQEKYNKCNAELKKAAKTIDSLKKELQDCQFDLYSLRANFNYDEVREKMPNSLDNDGLLAEKHARLNNDIAQLQKDREQFEQQKQLHIHSTSNQRAHKEVDTSNSDKRLADVDTAKERIGQEIQTLEEEKTKLKNDIERAKGQRLADVDTAKERIGQEIQTLEEEKTKLKNDIERAKGQRHTLEEENTKLKNDIEKVQGQRQTLDEEKTKLKNDIEKAQVQRQTLEEEKTKLKNDIKKAQGQRNQEKSKHDTSISHGHTDATDMKEKYESELKQKQLKLEEEKRKYIQLENEDLKKAHREKLEKMESELEGERQKCRELNTNIEALRTAHSEELKKMKSDLEDKSNEILRQQRIQEPRDGMKTNNINEKSTDDTISSKDSNIDEKKLEEEKRKNTQLKKDIEDLKKVHREKLEKMESERKEAKDTIEQNKHDMDDLKKKYADESRGNGKEMKDLQAKHKALEKQLEEEKKNIQKDMIDLQAKHKALEKQLEEEKNDIQKLKESRPRTGNSKEKELTEEIKKLKTRLKEVQSKTSSSKERELMEEIENLKTRLSQMAGAQLMANNPNIADLSDANRPTKLAEHYTELYDNEWTNAYEVLEENGKSELEIIQTLYALLKETYTFCIRVSTEQIRRLKLAVTSVLQKGEPTSDNNMDITKLRQLRDLRKTFAPDVIESVFQFYKQEKKPRDIDKPAMKEFIHKCITLCWLMNVQNPPVVVDIKPHAGSFNGDTFRTYTKTGKTIDYVVWPPLYLHEGGPMLSKGIAQGK